MSFHICHEIKFRFICLQRYKFSTDFPSKAVSNFLFLSKINLVDCINVSVSIHKNQILFDFAMNNTLKHVSQPIFLLSLFSIMVHTYEGRKEGRKMSVSSLHILGLWNMNNRRKVDLKSVNSPLKSVQPKYVKKGGLEHQKRPNFKPEMSGTQGMIQAYFVI